MKLDLILAVCCFVCVLEGLALIAVDLVALFIRLEFAQRPQPGMGILLLTVGLIGFRLLR